MTSTLRDGVVLIKKLKYITDTYTCVYMKWQFRFQDSSYWDSCTVIPLRKQSYA